jgi:hypothetical protein
MVIIEIPWDSFLVSRLVQDLEDTVIEDESVVDEHPGNSNHSHTPMSPCNQATFAFTPID